MKFVMNQLSTGVVGLLFPIDFEQKDMTLFERGLVFKPDVDSLASYTSMACNSGPVGGVASPVGGVTSPCGAFSLATLVVSLVYVVFDLLIV